MTRHEGQLKNMLFCQQECCLLKEREMPVFPGYGCVWTQIAREDDVLLVGVRSCEQVFVSQYLEAASLLIVN